MNALRMITADPVLRQGSTDAVPLSPSPLKERTHSVFFDVAGERRFDSLGVRG